MDISRLTSSLHAYPATQVDSAGTDPGTPVPTPATETSAPAQVRFTSNVVSINSRASATAESTQASNTAWTADTRQQKLADLKSAILNGSYKIPSGAVAQTLIDSMKNVALDGDPL